MVDQSLIDSMNRIRSDDMILVWKKNYNIMVEKAVKANTYMDAESVSAKEKDIQLLKYVIEIVEPLGRYVEILEKLGIEIPRNPFDGFPEAR